MLPLEILVTAILAIMISAIITRVLIPWIIDASLRRGITTVDVHKPNHPKIAEAGGIAPLLGFIFTILIIMFTWQYFFQDPQIFEPLLA